LPTGARLAYNQAGQLTTLTRPGGQTTTNRYDADGRRVYTDATGSGGTPASATSYSYTATGSLATATTNDASIAYTSDGTGLRQSRTENGTTTHDTWAVIGTLPLLLDDGTHHYLYGPGGTPYAQVDP